MIFTQLYGPLVIWQVPEYRFNLCQVLALVLRFSAISICLPILPRHAYVEAVIVLGIRSRNGWRRYWISLRMLFMTITELVYISLFWKV